MKICFICSEYPPGPHGGIGSVTQVLARALAQAGHAVRVVGTYPAAYPAPDYQEDEGVLVWRLREPARRFGWIRARYRLFRTVARWARAKEIDLVELPDWAGQAAFWPRLAVPLIVRLHGSISYHAAETGMKPSRQAFALEKASLRRADYWCSVSRYAADSTRALFGGPPQVTVVYNPVASQPQKTLAERSRQQVLFTGTLAARKGIVSLIRAWPQVAAECGNAELYILGKDGKTADGQSVQASLVSQLDSRAASRVHFLGHVDHDAVLAHLLAARVGVFPSYSESFGLAPVEAMASGCPTIYTSRSCGPEIVRDGIDGLLVDPDQPEEIAAALLRLLTEDDLASRLGRAGRERVRTTFSLPALLAKNEAFYQQCLDTFGART